ncbi:MAG: hypothetical protein NT080_08065 [Spirochaetes bacterium]|nr:hypothetical protein [Spirochaetota bacterium]
MEKILAITLACMTAAATWAQGGTFEGEMLKLGRLLAEAYAPESGALFKATVSVGDFETIGPTAASLRMGDTVREALITVLGRSTVFTVVDRRNLDAVLSEMELQLSGITDPEQVSEAGLLAGAEAIVYGSVTEEADAFVVNCRIVKVETGIVESVTASLPRGLFVKAAEDRLDRLYVQPMGVGIAVYGMGMTLSGDKATPVPYPGLDATFLRTEAGAEVRYRFTKNLMVGLGGEWLYGQVWYDPDLGWDLIPAGWPVPDDGSAPFTIVANGFGLPVSVYATVNPVRWLSLIARVQAEYCLLNFEGYFDPSNGKGFGINEFGPRLNAELFLFQFQAGAEAFVTPRASIWLLTGYRLGSTELETSMLHLPDLPPTIDVDLSGFSMGAGVAVYF